MFFSFFLYIFKGDVVFIQIRKHLVYILIVGGSDVAISVVLALTLEIHVFSEVRCQ